MRFVQYYVGTDSSFHNFSVPRDIDLPAVSSPSHETADVSTTPQFSK